MKETQDLDLAGLDQETIELHEVTVRLGWIARRRMEQHLEPFGITAPQFMALRCASDRAEGCSMTRLAEASHQVTPTMTGIVDRLVEQGLVQRVRDQTDRRALRVVVTPAGRDLIERINQHQRGWVRQFLKQIAPEERQVMIAMARGYLEVIEKLGV